MDKRIGLLVPNLLPGGAERVVALTSKLLSEKGYIVYIILFDSSKISYEIQGSILNLNSKPGNNYVLKILKRISRILKLSYCKYKYKLDVVISFLFSANVVHFYSKGHAKKILSCRGYSDFLKNGIVYSKMMKNIDSFVVQTSKMKNDFKKKYNADISKIEVLYNPIDFYTIQSKLSEDIETNIISFIQNHKTICTVGSFKKDKGYWHLIRSFLRVKESIPNAGLIFIGDRGEMESEIRLMAKKTIYANDILFLGYRENPYKYISKCDLYVCSSIFEGFPNALVEAMACGIAVISTDCLTGPKEILSSSDNEIVNGHTFCDWGVLVPDLGHEIDYSINTINEDEIYLANGIVELLSNNSILKYYSAISIERAKSFSCNDYVEKLISFFN